MRILQKVYGKRELKDKFIFLQNLLKFMRFWLYTFPTNFLKTLCIKDLLNSIRLKDSKELLGQNLGGSKFMGAACFFSGSLC